MGGALMSCYHRAVAVRVYSSSGDRDEVDEIVASSIATARQGETLFRKIIFAVPRDKDHPDNGAGPMLRKWQQRCGVFPKNVEVNMYDGNQNTDVQNSILRYCSAWDCVPLMMSNKASPYLCQSTVDALYDSFDAGRFLSGLELPELTGKLLFPIQNVFAVWNPEAVLAADGFDAPGGCEEIAPALRIVNRNPYARIGLLRAEPNQSGLRIRPASAAAYETKVASKAERQQTEADRLGLPIESLQERIDILTAA